MARVAVAVDAAHAEFVEAAEQGHFFGADLAGAEERDAFRAVARWMALKRAQNSRRARVPIDGAKLAGVSRGAAEWCRDRARRAA